MARTDDPRSFEWDVAVVGAGFGGLGAALRLAEHGARVLLLEALSYPGGCASTFTRGGASFESGATLFSGLGPGGLFRGWIERLGIDVSIDWLDPVIELRTPDVRLPLSGTRADFERALLQLDGAPTEDLQRFLRHQRRVADALWGLLDEPRLLPPFGGREALEHLRRLPRYAPILRDLGRPLARVLERYGVARFAPLRQLLEALCQITVQCGVEQAEAPIALAALDYPWRGTGHVRGGVGHLAKGLVGGLRSMGGEVRYSARVRAIEPSGGGWKLHTRRGAVSAGRVVANLLPHDLDCVLDPRVARPPRLGALAGDVETGWGACMLYLVLACDGRPPTHLDLTADPGAPCSEGNHVFCSISGVDDGPRTRDGHVTATLSTHVPMKPLRAGTGEERAHYIASVQERMRATLRALAPEVDARVVTQVTASPRTFQRFTGRFQGHVGGVPRRAGLGPYFRMHNPDVARGLALVGDSIFPGQGILAAALGGWKLAERWANECSATWAARTERALPGYAAGARAPGLREALSESGE